MPPPMPNPAKRMTANPARPVQRYRPGKVLAEAESSDDEEEEDEEEAQQKAQPQRRPQTTHRPSRRAQVAAPRDDSDDEDDEGFITEDEDEDGGVAVAQATSGVRDISTQATSGSGVLAKDEDEASEEDDSESEEGSSEEESSSEDKPQRKFQRPTFIKKADRKLDVPKSTANPALTTSTDITPQPEIENEDVEARRLATTEALIKDRIQRDALARAAGKKSWDDDDVLAPENMVDDTDGLDPEGEYAAWKLRELKRLKRDREAIEEREREIEEAERRKGLTAEERDREDQEFITQQKEEREAGRGETSYLARYHHKGAFFQGDEAAEILRKRDIMGARFVDDVDKEKLPEYMKIRDMTKLGKKGRTRHTDLKGQDTGAFGRDVMRWRPGDSSRNSDGTIRGVDERFMPDRDGDGRDGPTGANASVVGERRVRRERSRSPRRERADEDSYQPGKRSHSRSRSPRRERPDEDSYQPGKRSHSRSRSPLRKRRSPSPYRERDKRRKVDAL